MVARGCALCAPGVGTGAYASLRHRIGRKCRGQFAHFLAGRGLSRLLPQRRGQQRRDPRHLRLPHALRGHRRGAQAEATGCRRAEGRRCPARSRRPRSRPRARRVRRRPSGRGVRGDQMGVRAAGRDGQPLPRPARPRAPARWRPPDGRTRRTPASPPPRTRPPWRRRCASAAPPWVNGKTARSTRSASSAAAQDHPAARPAQHLVRRGADDVGVRHRVGAAPRRPGRWGGRRRRSG